MTYNIFPCDCVDAMRHLMEAESVDSIVTDPPYELTSIVKRFGKAGSAPAQHGTDGAFARASRGFMGQTWDGSGIAFDPAMWAEAYRVLKPGGYMLAFSGSRTYHRMVCAIEDAGFEIRDQIMWLYGSGFPKSLDVSKAIDKAAGHWRGRAGNVTIASQPAKGTEYERTEKDDPVTPEAQQWAGWGTALKPAHEPIVVARKPLAERTVAANVLRYGTGAINIDGCRVGDSGGTTRSEQAPYAESGWRTGHEVLTLNAGRFPANIIHDGSDEVLAAFPNTASGKMRAGTPRAAQDEPGSIAYGTYGGDTYGDSGSAARFFYAAKASKADRDEGLEHMPAGNNMRVNAPRASEADKHATQRANFHPTVKPTNLMRYLCRLVTPPGGTVFDPFTGSGSTGKAAILEGFQFIGCEMTPEYVPIATARIQAAIESVKCAS